MFLKKSVRVFNLFYQIESLTNNRTQEQLQKANTKDLETQTNQPGNSESSTSELNFPDNPSTAQNAQNPDTLNNETDSEGSEGLEVREKVDDKSTESPEPNPDSITYLKKEIADLKNQIAALTGKIPSHIQESMSPNSQQPQQAGLVDAITAKIENKKKETQGFGLKKLWEAAKKNPIKAFLAVTLIAGGVTIALPALAAASTAAFATGGTYAAVGTLGGVGTFGGIPVIGSTIASLPAGLGGIASLFVGASGLGYALAGRQILSNLQQTQEIDDLKNTIQRIQKPPQTLSPQVLENPSTSNPGTYDTQTNANSSNTGEVKPASTERSRRTVSDNLESETSETKINLSEFSAGSIFTLKNQNNDSLKLTLKNPAKGMVEIKTLGGQIISGILRTEYSDGKPPEVGVVSQSGNLVIENKTFEFNSIHNFGPNCRAILNENESATSQQQPQDKEEISGLEQTQAQVSEKSEDVQPLSNAEEALKNPISATTDSEVLTEPGLKSENKDTPPASNTETSATPDQLVESSFFNTVTNTEKFKFIINQASEFQNGTRDVTDPYGINTDQGATKETKKEDFNSLVKLLNSELLEGGEGYSAEELVSTALALELQNPKITPPTAGEKFKFRNSDSLKRSESGKFNDAISIIEDNLQAARSVLEFKAGVDKILEPSDKEEKPYGDPNKFILVLLDVYDNSKSKELKLFIENTLNKIVDGRNGKEQLEYLKKTRISIERMAQKPLINPGNPEEIAINDNYKLDSENRSIQIHFNNVLKGFKTN